METSDKTLDNVEWVGGKQVGGRGGSESGDIQMMMSGACGSCKSHSLQLSVPTDSPSRDGNVTVDVFDINQPSLPTPFYSVLVSISVFMALST